MSKKNNYRTVVETQQIGWIQLHTQIAADDTSLRTNTNRNFSERPAETVKVPYGINEAIITFLGTPTNQATAFGWKLWGYRGLHGPAQLIAYGTGNLGAVACTEHPCNGAAVALFYADYLTITAEVWAGAISVVNVGATGVEIATLNVDLIGVSNLLMELTDVGSGTEPSALEAIYCGV